MKGLGFVKITQGPLQLVVSIDQPMTREQLEALAPLAQLMADVESLFRPVEGDDA